MADDEKPRMKLQFTKGAKRAYDALSPEMQAVVDAGIAELLAADDPTRVEGFEALSVEEIEELLDEQDPDDLDIVPEQ